MKRCILVAALSLAIAVPAIAQNLFSPATTVQDVKNAAAAGTDFEAANKDGLTPLIYAAGSNGNMEVLKALIAIGAKPDAETPTGYTALAYAAYNQANPEAIRVLLGAGAAVDHPNKSGMTPLMWAARHNPNPEIARALIAGGASRTLKSKEGKTAYDYAAENDKVKASPVYADLGSQRSNDERARELYTAALSLYTAGRHTAVVEKVDAAVAYLGATNLRLQPVLIRSLVALKNHPRAKAELTVYFGIATDQTLAEYAEMKDLSGATEKALKQDESGFQAARKLNEWQTFLVYLNSYPYGLHRSEVSEAMSQLDGAAYANAVKVATVPAYTQYLSQYPGGGHAEDITARRASLIDDSDWDTVRSRNTKDVYEAYQKYYPQGRHVAEARAAWQVLDKAEKEKAAAKASARKEAERAELARELESQRSEAAGHYTLGALKLGGGVGLGALGGWLLYDNLGSSSSSTSSSSDNTLAMIGAGGALGVAVWLLLTFADDFESGNDDSSRADDTASTLDRLSAHPARVPTVPGDRERTGFGITLRVPLGN